MQIHDTIKKKLQLICVSTVMASDGLWDTHTNEEVVDKIRKSMRSRFVQSRDVANRASKAIL